MKCLWCSSEAEEGKRKCSSCLAKDRAISKRKRAKRKKSGLCKNCPNTVEVGSALCNICKAAKRVDNKSRRATRSAAGLCTECDKKPEPGLVRCRDCLNRQKAKRDSLRLQAISGYGGRCLCCGETEPLFLQLDHVHNNGAAERRILSNSRQLYRKVIEAGFPNDYQLLCANCNFGRHLNGGVCPHKRSGAAPG